MSQDTYKYVNLGSTLFTHLMNLLDEETIAELYQKVGEGKEAEEMLR